jgi:hypothetical protein
MQNAPVVKRQANLDGRDLRAQINGAHWILEPPAFLPLSGGGGSGIEGAPLDGYDQSAQINGAHRIPDPPAFLPLRRGGGLESRAHLSDGYDQSTQINGAQAFRTSLSSLLLINVGPSPVVSPLELPLPCSLSSTSLHSMALSVHVLLPASMCPPLSMSPVHASSWHTFSFFSFSPDTSCQVFFVSQLASPPPSVPPPYDFPVISLQHYVSS